MIDNNHHNHPTNNSEDNNIVTNYKSSEMDFERLINGDTDRLISRTSNLLQNKSFTDVTFIVGPASHSKKYVGHRVLLAMTSPGEFKNSCLCTTNT